MALTKKMFLPSLSKIRFWLVNRPIYIHYLAAVIIAITLPVVTWASLHYELLDDMVRNLWSSESILTDNELENARENVINKLKSEYNSFVPATTFGDLHMFVYKQDHFGESDTYNIDVLVLPYQGVIDKKGEIISEKILTDLYGYQYEKIHLEELGTFIIAENNFNFKTKVSWVAYEGKVPVIIAMRYDSPVDSKISNTTVTTTNAPALLKSLLKLYPPRTALTDDLLLSLNLSFNKYRGYRSSNVLKEETNQNGDIFTMIAFSVEEQHTSYSDCASFMYKGEPVFDGNWDDYMARIKKRFSCEFTITTSSTSQSYSGEEAEKLGGLPQKWLSVDEIQTEVRLVSSGGCDQWKEHIGVFDVPNEKYKRILKIIRPGCFDWRAIIEYELGDVKERLLFVQGHGEYLLYRINSDKDLSDLFDETKMRREGIGHIRPMIDYLKKVSTIELELVGSMRLEKKLLEIAGENGYVRYTSNQEYIINIDENKNILFELGAADGGFQKFYIYTMGKGIVERNSLN